MATVVIPSLLRKLTGGQDRIQASGSTLGQLVDDLEKRFPGFRQYVVEGGELKPSLAVSVDGEFGTLGLLEPISDTSEVYILPALGGGLPGKSRRSCDSRAGHAAVGIGCKPRLFGPSSARVSIFCFLEPAGLKNHRGGRDARGSVAQVPIAP